MNILNDTRFSGAPKLRLIKGDKKRPVMVVRPSLKKIQSRLDKIRHVCTHYRGQLRRTSVLDGERQTAINAELLRLKQVKEGILRYVDNMTSPRN